MLSLFFLLLWLSLHCYCPVLWLTQTRWRHIWTLMAEAMLEIMNSRKLTISTELLGIVTGYNAGAPVTSSFLHVHLKFVKTPENQPHNLPSIWGCPVPDESDNCSVTCKLQECNRQVLWGVAINMEGEEQGGKHISLGGIQCWWVICWIWFSPPLLLSACQGVCEPLTDGSWHGELSVLGVEDFWNDGVKCRATHRVLVYDPGCLRCRSPGTAVHPAKSL